MDTVDEPIQTRKGAIQTAFKSDLLWGLDAPAKRQCLSSIRSVNAA
jgi:hypothetical protein